MEYGGLRELRTNFKSVGFIGRIQLEDKWNVSRDGHEYLEGTNYFHDIAMAKLHKISKTDEVIDEVTDNKQDWRTIRRRVLNFVGEISKIFFGTQDDDDANYYNKK